MYKNLLLSYLLILLFAFSLNSQVSLIFPKNKYIFDSTTIHFSWNSHPSANDYQLQIATDSTFLNVLLDANNLSSLDYTAQNLTPNTIYYWRIKANNLSWSNTYSFTIVDFRTWPELEFMLDPDSVVLDANGNIEQWTDLSGNANHFGQTNSGNRPSLSSESKANNQSSIDFNPNNQNFLSGVDLSHLNEGEIFSLVKKNIFPPLNNSKGSIWRFGTSNGLDLYPHTNSNMYSGFGRSIRFENFFIPDSLEMCSPHIVNISSGSEFRFSHNNNIKIITTNGISVFTTEVILGQGRPNLNYFFDGSFGQILFFNTVLNDSLKDIVNNQMQIKYAPPANLGANISQYGFCDTVIYAGERFTSYLWSDASTADSLITNSPGTYWVEVEDIFGFISRDSIEVLSGLQYPTTQLYCQNDSITWQTSLGQHYSYLWSDNSTADTLIIDSPGDYHVIVTDTNGCIFMSDTLNFAEDPFPTTVSLGPDLNICSGNQIALTTGANNTTNYLWNNGETTPQITINTSGSYSVIVQNANGCEVKDTIDVTILGDAPIVNTQLPSTICVNEPFNFQDLSTTTDGSTITGWDWGFDDGTTSILNQGTYSYSTGGIYYIDLTVETSVGCFMTQTATIEVKEAPILTFATANQCQDESIQFNGGQLSPQTITNWEWNFDDPTSGTDNLANGQNSSHTFTSEGDYNVMLIGTDIFGCIDTLIQTKTIEPSPITSFTFTEVCEGNIVSYQNTSNIASPSSISSNQWDFGDGTNSNQNSPQKPYSLYGTYTVELTTTANNGCNNSISKNIKIHATPQISFIMGQACAGLETSFENVSFIPDGSVAQVDWAFDNQTAINGFDITKVFANSGTYSLEQSVSSGFGCINSADSNITINPFLKADFNFTPNAFIAAYPIVFESTSSGENEYLWTFGNITTSNQADTSIVFDESQIGTEQTVELRVKNEWDCLDSIAVKMTILEQRTDLEISQLFSQEINGFLTIGVRLKNIGSTPISEVDLVLNSPSSSFIKETWTGILQADEEEIYIFSASPSAQVTIEDSLQNFICIKGSLVQPAQFTEGNLSNNEVCKTMADDQTVIVFPYPNPVKNELTVKVVMPKQGVIALRIYDDRGKMIYMITEKQELVKGLNVFVIETNTWSSGKYNIVFEGEGSVPTVGFVKL